MSPWKMAWSWDQWFINCNLWRVVHGTGLLARFWLLIWFTTLVVCCRNRHHKHHRKHIHLKLLVVIFKPPGQKGHWHMGNRLEPTYRWDKLGQMTAMLRYPSFQCVLSTQMKHIQKSLRQAFRILGFWKSLQISMCNVHLPYTLLSILGIAGRIVRI